MPNIFTSGNDGLNDLFEVKGINDEFNLKIYNSWGQEVLKSEFPGKWWNGNSENGETLPGEIYFYLLNIKNDNENYHGTIQMIRN